MKLNRPPIKETLTVITREGGEIEVRYGEAMAEYLRQLFDHAEADRYTCGRLSNMGTDPFDACHYCPENGDTALINGRPEKIPDGNLSVSGGVTATYASCSIDKVLNQAAPINTLLYQYLYMRNGVMTMDFSTTMRALDTRTGSWVKSGDPTCSLIGLCYINGSRQTKGSAKAQTIASWFNRVKYYLVANLTGNTSSGSYVELDSAARCEWVQWSDDLPLAYAEASLTASAAGDVLQVACGGMVSGGGSLGTANGKTGSQAAVNTSDGSCDVRALPLNPGGEGYFATSFLGRVRSGAGSLTVDNGFLFVDNVMS